jgi:hypothetical protein
MHALRSYQKILEETIMRMQDLIRLPPEGEIPEKLVKEISTLDVTADAILWAVQLMDPQIPDLSPGRGI